MHYVFAFFLRLKFIFEVKRVKLYMLGITSIMEYWSQRIHWIDQTNMAAPILPKYSMIYQNCMETMDFDFKITLKITYIQCLPWNEGSEIATENFS